MIKLPATRHCEKKRETVEDEVGRVHRVKAEVGKAEVPQDELGRNP